MEHGIIRGNRKSPQAYVAFSKTDPRRAFSDTEFDPRIHFLLTNGNGDLVGYDPRLEVTVSKPVT
jgi:hypothetical protein